METLIFSNYNIKGVREIEDKIETAKHSIIYLDLTNNLLDEFNLKICLKNLQILLLDHNQIFTLKRFPEISSLDVLSLNSNNLLEVKDFCSFLLIKFPKLTLLNTLNNPMNPSFLHYEQYLKYREAFKSHKTLKLLDGISLFNDSLLDFYKDQCVTYGNRESSNNNMNSIEYNKNEIVEQSTFLENTPYYLSKNKRKIEKSKTVRDKKIKGKLQFTDL